jgi:transposase
MTAAPAESRSKRLNDAASVWIAQDMPAARVGWAATTTDLRGVLKAIFYLLRTGRQWPLPPREFPRQGHQVAGTYWNWGNALAVKRYNRKVGICVPV